MRYGKKLISVGLVILIAISILTLFFVKIIVPESRGDEVSSAEFSPPHTHFSSDYDQDGKDDVLTVNVSLDVNSNSTYSIFGHMYYSAFGGNGSGDVNLSWIYYYPGDNVEVSSIPLNIGSHTIQLNFSNIMIYNSDREGKWYVFLALADEELGILVDTGNYTITSLNATDFDIPPITLDSSLSDYGIDNDTDNKYNWLVVNVTLNIHENHSARVTGSLFNGNWSETIGVVDYIDDFEIGNETVKLWFNVSNHSSEVGPYEVVVKVCGSTQTYDELLYVATIESFEYE
jgi:hypothetical protein